MAETARQAQRFALAAKAANTVRAYRADWEDFVGWCTAQGLPALPAAPPTLALYLADLAQQGRKAATLQRRLSAISQAHQAAGQEPPGRSHLVRTVMAGIRRTRGTAQQGKAPLLTAGLRALVSTLNPETLAGQRDRALLLLGFAGAFRRSELVALHVEELAFVAEGLVVTLRRSKTDQEGQGARKGIPLGRTPETCPVRAVQAWLQAAGITAGPLFRGINRHGQLGTAALSDKAVALIVKRTAAAAGLDPARYAGHSLRAGLATAAAAAGVSERAIMAQTGHRSLTVVRRYIRDGSLFRENAADKVGL